MKDSSWLSVIWERIGFSFVLERSTQVKNQLDPANPLPLCKPIGIANLDEKRLGNTFELNVLKAADES